MVNERYNTYIGKQINNYTILQKLGDGGFAHVYLAQQKFPPSHLVAIKLLDPKYLNGKARRFFLHEAQFLTELAGLEHSHILSILGYGENEGTPYIVVEYAPGGTLRERINNPPPVTIDEALTILRQVGEAVHIAHQHNIVHCDLKPENILFSKNNDVVLADFGIATRLGAKDEFYGPPDGTYAYMAPEQFDGIFTKESDQYSLGCIAYELFTGRHPFEFLLPFNPQDRELMKERHKNAKSHSLSELNGYVSDHIEQAILQALAKKPSERHTSIASFIRSLQLSTSSPTPQPHHFTHALHTPPPYTSAPQEPQHPTTDPSRNPNSSSINLEECYEIIQPIECSGRALHDSRHCNPLVQSFPRNVNKDQIRNTDHSLPPIPGHTLERPKGTTQSRSRDPIKALQDLGLYQNPSLQEHLDCILKNFQLVLIERPLTDPYTGKERLCTRVQTRSSQDPVPNYYLLYIPRRFLTTTEKNISAIRDLGSAFPEKSTLIIFSDRNETLDLEIHSIITKQWKKKEKIEATFIPQKHVESIQKKNREFQEQWLTEEMHLYEALKAVKVSKSVQQMDGNDTETLVKILEKLPQLIDEPGRGGRTLLQIAGLGEIVSEFVLTGTARNIAWGLVDQLKRRARLPEYPDYEVLGLLLCYILALKDLPSKDCESIKQITRKYAILPPLRPL